MGGIKIRIHPLFFLFGIYYGITGEIAAFIIYTLVAIIHELGHSICASGYGYRLNKIILMPFGAVVTGETKGLKPLDQIKIAMSGPLVNLGCGFLCVAFWWIKPESYVITYIIAEASFVLGFINLIPAFPLDGGRVVYSIISLKHGKKVAKVTCRILGAVTFSVLIMLFILSARKKINLSLLFFALFILFGIFVKDEDAYVKAFDYHTEREYMRGLPVKRQALSVNATVKKLINIIDTSCINEVSLYENGKKTRVLEQEDIDRIIQKNQIYSTLKGVL